MEELRKRDLLVSKTWIQAVILVVVFGFFVLGLLAYRTYSGEAPIPARVMDQNGNTLFTHDDILDGQQVFLRNGLMEYGSIFGHGAYLGPDYTADYLRRSATSVYEIHGGQKSESANAQTVEEFKTNRYDAPSDTLTLTAAQSTAFIQLEDYYHSVFSDPSTRSGLRPGAIGDRREKVQFDRRAQSPGALIGVQGLENQRRCRRTGNGSRRHASMIATRL